MQKQRLFIYYFILSLFFFFVGGFLFLLNRNWVIIKIPNFNSFSSKDITLKQDPTNPVLRKKIKLFYFKNDKIQSETTTLVWFSNKADNIKLLINNWLSFMLDEKILERKTILETVCLSDFDSVAYISFDQNFLETNWSTYKKWKLIESLLKTLKDSDLNIKSVVFLVKNKYIDDDHLDFSVNWPIDGFLEN